MSQTKQEQPPAPPSAAGCRPKQPTPLDALINRLADLSEAASLHHLYGISRAKELIGEYVASELNAALAERSYPYTNVDGHAYSPERIRSLESALATATAQLATAEAKVKGLDFLTKLQQTTAQEQHEAYRQLRKERNQLDEQLTAMTAELGGANERVAKLEGFSDWLEKLAGGMERAAGVEENASEAHELSVIQDTILSVKKEFDVLRAAAQPVAAPAQGECPNCTNGIIRSLGRDNDEIIEDCPKCATPAQGEGNL